MKTNQYINLFLVALISFFSFSCSDLLTEKPDSYYSTESFFINAANVNMAVLGIYDVLAKNGDYGSTEIIAPTSDDQYIIRGTVSDNARQDISHYMVAPQNTLLRDLWAFKYQGIDRANFTIEHIHQMPGYVGADSTILRQYEGEARFLRALLSYDLVKCWGDVPYKTTATANINQAYFGRVGRDTIYSQIVDDLNFAKINLPWAAAGSNPERATSGAARAMLMRVLLSRAGYSLSLSGHLTRLDDAKRADYFNQIINEYDAFLLNGYHNFFPSYYQFFKNNSAGVLNSLESIFEVSFFSSTGSTEDSGLWGSFIGPLTDQYSPYGRANSYLYAVPEWDAWYDVKDLRRVTNICKYTVNVKGDSVPIPASTKMWYPGKWRRNWMPTAPKDPNNTDVNFCLLRYADVVLMYAEALNEVGRTTDAVMQLNRIRARVNLTPLAVDFSNYATIYKAPKVKNLTYIADADNQGKFRTALYWERGFELCYEGTRKYDLIRWGILNDAIMNTTTSLGAAYKAKTQFITGKNELFPIPQQEMDANPKLNHINNNGYN